MATDINTHPGFDDVKVGSLVYYRAGEDWQSGLVVEKVFIGIEQPVSRKNALCFKLLIAEEKFSWFSLRELMLIEMGEN